MKVKITPIANGTLLKIDIQGDSFGGSGGDHIVHPGQALFGKTYEEYLAMGEGEHEWDDAPPERINLER